MDNKSFVEDEIAKLVRLGCISQVGERPKVINPLTVAFNKKNKPRLVLDCRHINPHLFKFKFKYEDAQVARELFEKGDYLFSFDFKSAYHHIEILPEHRNYLGFAWDCEGRTKYFIFIVLPFGLSTAGHIFTKLLREPVRYLRSQGVNIITFLDDGIAGGNSYDVAQSTSHSVRTQLERLGFLFSHEKCTWDPCIELKWLGYIWNMEMGKLFVCQERIDSLTYNLRTVIEKVKEGQVLFYARFLAKIVGQIISTKAVFGNVVRLYTRSLYQCILDKASWNAKVKLSANALNEVQFWCNNVEQLNKIGCDLQTVTASDVCDFTLFCDASDVGFGGYVIPGNEDSGCSEIMNIVGTWSTLEAGLSSTWRELESVKRVVQSSTDLLSNSFVNIITDNKNVPTILKIGSKKPYLQDVSMNFTNVCKVNNISYKCKWLPRCKNEKADLLSRQTDADDWSINDDVFKELDSLWGKHTIGRFASHHNNKCNRFNSKIW